MLRRARSCESKSSVRPSVRLSVCPSVTFSYRDHIVWNSSKIIIHGRIAYAHNDPNMGDLVPPEHPKIRVE